MKVSIFAIGDDLLAAKEVPATKLPHGEFEKMVKDDLAFGPRSARMYMAIARDTRLRNRNHGSVLPPYWRTLYELSRFDDVTFRRLIRDGTINPNTEREEVRKLLRQHKVERDERRVLELRPRRGRFRTLIFDPAWDYQG
jgi:hypothetical protein